MHSGEKLTCLKVALEEEEEEEVFDEINELPQVRVEQSKNKKNPQIFAQFLMEQYKKFYEY